MFTWISGNSEEVRLWVVVYDVVRYFSCKFVFVSLLNHSSGSCDVICLF